MNPFDLNGKLYKVNEENSPKKIYKKDVWLF
jgi:hypothetical protein